MSLIKHNLWRLINHFRTTRLWVEQGRVINYRYEVCSFGYVLHLSKQFFYRNISRITFVRVHSLHLIQLNRGILLLIKVLLESLISLWLGRSIKDYIEFLNSENNILHFNSCSWIRQSLSMYHFSSLSDCHSPRFFKIFNCILYVKKFTITNSIITYI